jgi:hypothetical protein
MQKFEHFQTEFLGSSGVIDLDSNGERSEICLDILQLNPTTVHRHYPFQLVAVW